MRPDAAGLPGVGRPLKTTAVRVPCRKLPSAPPLRLDMRSVLKASQAISEELELEGILEKLIHSLLECAGAQHIYYLSRTDSGYEIQSEGAIPGPRTYASYQSGRRRTGIFR